MVLLIMIWEILFLNVRFGIESGLVYSQFKDYPFLILGTQPLLSSLTNFMIQTYSPGCVKMLVLARHMVVVFLVMTWEILFP